MTTRLFAANGIDVSIHRMRHAFGTRMLRAGTNICVIQSLMLHASLNSTTGHLEISEDERIEGISRLEPAERTLGEG